MKLLFIGDIVGNMGRSAIAHYLPLLKKKYRPQVTIANGENVSNGRGITLAHYKELLQWGIDVITLGNHAWDQRETIDFIEDVNKLVRPANYAEGVKGEGIKFIKVNQYELAVINLQGRVFMNSLEDPFRVADRLIEQCKKRTPFIFIDFHAEATSEKQAFAWYVDGRASAVVGTHTHIQTNDARILPGGTGYVTDVGMTGAYDSVLGMERQAVIHKFLTQLPTRFEVPKEGRFMLSACLIELDDKTGKTKKIESFILNDDRPFMS